MASLDKLQLELKNQIEKAKINFKKTPKTRINQFYVESRLENLEQQWNLFVQNHTKIICEVAQEMYEKSNYYTQDAYGNTEESYFEYKGDLREALMKLETVSVSTRPNVSEINQTCPVKLPRISIPTFSGNYNEWISFRDLFISLVHSNKSLDDVQKLHYLKAHLTGEAEQLLRHIPITSTNYNICWSQLDGRYNNRKHLSNSILKRFLGQKSLVSESSKAIKELLDTTTECLNALKNLGIDVSTWDIIVIYITSLKLDNETRKQWESKISDMTDKLPTLTQFTEFLEQRFRSLEFLDNQSQRVQRNVNNFKSLHIANEKCQFCTEGHKLCHCKKFANETVDARRNFVQVNRICYNCLGTNHSVYTCRQNTKCRICKRKHHSLLHTNIAQPSVGSSSLVSSQPTENNVVNVATTSRDDSIKVVSCLATSHSQVLLATALVRVQSPRAGDITFKALLDQGSQASFITESAVQLLGLQKMPSKSLISGLGSDEGTSMSSRWVVYVKIQSLQDPNFVLNVRAHVLGKITTYLPEKTVDLECLAEYPKFKLADPTFDQPNKIDLLLGAEVYAEVLVAGFYRGSPGTPVAQNTKLGWILSGNINNNSCIDTLHYTVTVVNMHTTVDEDEILKRFWELESEHSSTTAKPLLSVEEQRCEDLFPATTTRDDSGRYIVKLPFREATPMSCDGNLRDIAARRFLLLERRFQRNPELHARYISVMQEYLALGHMELVPEQDLNRRAVYLPHHPVIREDKTTSKVRVVFDASCSGTNGVSLNKDLMVGPQLQPDLRHIVMRWRRYPVCITSDIIKMYRQVKVVDSDIDYQRIFWRESPESVLQHFRLLRVTFGMASAPYLAVRALQQLAYDHGDRFPMVRNRVLQDFYMDDIMTGCESVEEALQIYNELTELLKLGGFELQKWSSNSIEFMERIMDKQDDDKLELKKDEVSKILGLDWDRNTDTFQYTVSLPELSKPITKRKVISDISRLFDPLGWIAPTIVVAKMYIQKLWMMGLEWDQEVPVQFLNEWLQYRKGLTDLKSFKLPRWNHTSEGDVSRELHGFCDASTNAFAAVVYLRVVQKSGEVVVSLITSKTKVAPIKQVSIPRLELCGAVLLSKLLAEVVDVLSVSKQNVFAWTDSSVCLAWLSSHPSRWQTFIANRVSEILLVWERRHWYHVNSKDNPADCASRGLNAKELTGHELWIRGPKWLWKSQIEYREQEREDTTIEEKKKKVCHMATHVVEQDKVWTRYSTLGRLVRIIAYCRRFLRAKKSHDKTKSTTWLNHNELSDALRVCVRHFQRHHFGAEVDSLTNSSSVSKKSKLYSFTPFLDEYGIIRVGGRLNNSDLNENMKHPILLAGNCHFTNLIVADAHIKTLHGGPQLMLNFLRTKYWILDAKNRVKYCVRRCVTCVRYAAQTPQQLMGQLPTSRVTACRPFNQCGVDYAGPISIRTTKGRGHHAYKGYICLFVCMATRAIHLEAVSDMTSEGFLAAFKRFVARRGHCSDLWSDNGTNFVGANRELQQLFAKEKASVVHEIAEWLGNNGTNWHFIPPHAPNFGGLWEAGVKSTKHHLKRVIGDNNLTFEEMSTLLYQIEACLNSRPLTKSSVNPNDPYPLTPGHFLIGEPIMLMPDYNFENSNISTLRRWQLTQRLVQDFWRRWSSEYLVQFYQRHKWHNQEEEPKIGDVVLVKEDGLPPARWLYGVIIDKHPGQDNLTRVVSLRCKNNIIKRPISKICILPTEN